MVPLFSILIRLNLYKKKYISFKKIYFTDKIIRIFILYMPIFFPKILSYSLIDVRGIYVYRN